jgi:hypothetical protein
MTRTVRLLIAAVLAVAGAAVTGVVIAVPAAAAPATCATSWGSLAKSAPPLGAAPLVAVRTGRNTCFDRVVFDLDGPAAGFSVEYVDAVVQDGSGAVLPVPGGARLQVQLHHPSYDQQGNPTSPASAPGSPSPTSAGTTPSARSCSAAASRATRRSVSVSGRACRSGRSPSPARAGSPGSCSTWPIAGSSPAPGGARGPAATCRARRVE